MIKAIKYLSMLAGGLLLGGMFAGCAREELNVSEPGDDSIFSVAEDEYGLGVTLSLNPLTGSPTRAALSDMSANELKDIEEYVNTENLYILFFDLEGIFLFQINKPVAIPIGQSPLGNDCQWFIRIPVKEINENLIHYIEEHPFKIAVLANWTFDADVNLGENLGGWDEFRFREPLDEKGNLQVDEYGKLQGDHISLLSHAQRDEVYENLSIRGYDHLVYRTETGPHMGPYTEWVRNYHGTIPKAENDIRNNYDVLRNKYSNEFAEKRDESLLGGFTMEYNNLWHLWHFGGKDESKFAFDAGASQKRDWLALNEVAKNNWKSDRSENPEAGADWKMTNYEDLYIGGGIRLNEEENGLVLTGENITRSQNAAGEPLVTEGGHYIHFKANADGYVRVNYEASNGAELWVHIGRNNDPGNDQHYLEDNQKIRWNFDGADDRGVFGDIPFEPKDVYIYMVKGSDTRGNDEEENEENKPSVTIYSIEYIESRHLYDVDRHGILPTKEYPIPMYGIQDYDAIGEYWEPGVLFNLSQFNNAQKQGYNYRTISLLRSLSRVEVKLLKSVFPKKPSHVYLRSMNRSARITPVDFFTPTDIIWNGFDESSGSDIARWQNYATVGNLREQDIIKNTPGVRAEWENIMQYGPIYIGTDANSGQTAAQKLNEYRKTTAWPFGIWEHQWGWDWNRGTEYVDHFDTYRVGQQRAHTNQIVPEYPRILHTRISRSDYARFTEVEDPDYWHYIMYIPEKNITDADEPGNIADRPKIIHVELRFNGGFPVYDKNGNPSTDDPENKVDNFDDKAAYRLYFTEGGRARLGDFEFTGRDSWDAYEYDWNIARQHWPIIRNHVYIFTVNGGIDNSADVTLQVLGPEKRGANWFFY